MDILTLSAGTAYNSGTYLSPSSLFMRICSSALLQSSTFKHKSRHRQDPCYHHSHHHSLTSLSPTSNIIITSSRAFTAIIGNLHPNLTSLDQLSQKMAIVFFLYIRRKVQCYSRIQTFYCSTVIAYLVHFSIEKTI